MDDKIEILNARTDAVQYIGFSAKSSGKVSRWLSRKGYPDFIIEHVVCELITEHRIDDAALAERIIRERSGKRSESPRALARRLTAAGIPPPVAEEAVRRHYDQVRNEEEESAELLNLKFSREMVTMQEWDRTAIRKLQSRMYRFLLSRGYDSDLSLRTIELFLQKQGIHDTQTGSFG